MGTKRGARPLRMEESEHGGVSVKREDAGFGQRAEAAGSGQRAEAEGWAARVKGCGSMLLPLAGDAVRLVVDTHASGEKLLFEPPARCTVDMAVAFP